MKNLYLLLLVVLAFAKAPTAQAQTAYTVPSTPTAGDSVDLYLDTTGTGLENYNGTIYAHTGVTINGNQWQNVIGNWGQNAIQPAFTNLIGNLYVLSISPSIEAFYGVSSADVISEISLVARSDSGQQQTSPDIFLPVFAPGLNVLLTTPQANTVYNVGDTATITADASVPADLELFIDGVSVATATNATSITHNETFTTTGSKTIRVEAMDNGVTEIDQTSVYVSAATQVATQPAGLNNGATVNADGSVTFLLTAPLKSDVLLIGDFNGWTYDTNYQLARDGDDFWITVPASDFTPGADHLYQYVVDYDITTADPYSTLILDGNNDQFINAGNYPNLPAYPTSMTTGEISILRYQQTPYTWTTTNFVRPTEEELTIYELLVRDWSDDDSFQKVIDRIDYIDNLGVTAVQFMPLNEFEGNDSWGYNPSYHNAIDKAYGTPDKFKELVDLLHSRGIAVIVDVVYNHAFSRSALCQMWWDSANFRPAANNPYMNVTARHDFNVGYDMNHESPYTREYVRQTLQYWLDEYRIDGFRFDLSKGFTQNNTLGNIGAWNAYDQSRVDILQDYYNTIRNNGTNGGDAYMILEHLADNNEEQALSNMGYMLWGNLNGSFNQNTMGYSQNSDVSWLSYQQRGWNDPHVVGYMESHDEQRLVYRNIQFGNSTPSYDTSAIPTAYERIEPANVILYSTPGPKMLWMFGELGYDIDIDFNGRTGRKPVPFQNGYSTDPDRLALYNQTAEMIGLRKNNEIFHTTNFNLNVGGLEKRINLYDNTAAGNDVVAIANFDVQPRSINPNFSGTGVWYDYFNNNTAINVSNTSSTITLQPGEYRLYSRNPMSSTVSVDDVTVANEIVAYPNPAQNTVALSQDVDQVRVYTMTGQEVLTHQELAYGETLDVSNLVAGIYLLSATRNDATTTIRLVIE